MPNFAANLSMLFPEAEFLDRFGRAAEAGFGAVEYLFPYQHPAQQLRQRLDEHGLRQVLFNLPPGDWQAGERGLAALPGRETDFRDALERALDYAGELDCPRLHAMAGLHSPEYQRDRCQAVYRDNLAYAAERAAERGVKVLIEPINGRDVPGYFLNTPAAARELIDAIDHPNLRLQLDLYHCQIVGGDLATQIRTQLPVTEHVQIAGVPERHEPDVGEIHYPYLFRLLDQLGYRGWIGCEYHPQNPEDTGAGLGWLSRERTAA